MSHKGFCSESALFKETCTARVMYTNYLNINIVLFCTPTIVGSVKSVFPLGPDGLYFQLMTSTSRTQLYL